ncbi:MAG: photosystem II protein PsbQ [Prochloraceae cyanobacterium]
MSIIRSIFPLILVLITTLLVSCGSPNAQTTPNVYSAEQIEEIQPFLTPVKEFRQRIEELETLIDEENWIDVDNLIHGPLGDLRRDLRYLADSLLPEEQKQVKELAKKMFVDIERVDAAAKDRSYDRAVEQYNQTIKDFDDLLDIVPTSADT